MNGTGNTSDPLLSLWYGAKRSAVNPKADPDPTSPTGETGGRMKIAIQGEAGSFSHEAALKLVNEALIAPFSLSADVFQALVNHDVEAAVIPIENSLAGG